MAMQLYGSFVPRDELKLKVCRTVVARAQQPGENKLFTFEISGSLYVNWLE